MKYEPYTVAHDQRDAGLRAYRPAPIGPAPRCTPVRWPAIARHVLQLVVVFGLGFVAGRLL